jgi:hypothetical protein
MAVMLVASKVARKETMMAEYWADKKADNSGLLDYWTVDM